MSKNFTKEPIFETHPAAESLAYYILELVKADAALNDALKRIPDYTGQWNREDYVRDERENWNQMAELVYNAVARAK